MKVLRSFLLILLFTIAFILLSHHLFVNDLFFDSDIGRDFLLIEDVLSNKNLTLLGPRADGISGMFFGPHWIYLNIPIYVIGGGNPVLVAASWMILIGFSIFSVYYVGRKIFNKEVGVYAALLYSYLLVPYSAGFTQSFFAPLLAPWIVYFLSLYIQKGRFFHVSILLFLCGLLYQFQPAFGMIVIPFTILIVLYQVIKVKKYYHLLSFIFFAAAFALFALSELKTNFLQTNAFLNHITSSEESKVIITNVILTRLQVFFNILNFTKINLLLPIFLSIFIYILVNLKKAKRSLFKNYYIIFFVYIIGFFLISFLFKGRFNDYHTWGFLSLIAISISGLSIFLKKRIIYYIIMILILIFAIIQAVQFTYLWHKDFHNSDFLSWQANNKVAERIFENENSSFSYYIYSFDEFGYSMRYAMIYNSKIKNINANLCEKSDTTYLIYGPGPSGKYINHPTYWKEDRIRIKKDPAESYMLGEFLVEKYILTENEIDIPVDPNLICDLHFR